MVTATATMQPRESGKQKGVFKKVIRYLQDQALENSASRSLLSPPGLEPHQRLPASPLDTIHNQYPKLVISQRRFSEATTAVDARQNFRRLGQMASSDADASVFLGDASSSAKEMKKVQYAQENILQNYRIYIPERDPQTIQGSQYWIIYIHGGYFRDPKVDATSFKPALELLTAEETTTSHSTSLASVPESATPSASTSRSQLSRESDLVQRHVAGYVSINYRLSPHPAYPEDDDVENYIRRNAEFPQHLQDVHAAIRHLQTRYDITNNYVLAGHSVGATLSFLAALKAKDGQIDPPLCIVGLNGIYDFPHIHTTNPDYEFMTKNAMRPDQYQTASPALYQYSDFASILEKQQTLRVLLSHSRDDGLVAWSQLEQMQPVLQTENGGTRLHVETMETKGQHDAIWKEGKELARTVIQALKMLTDY